MKRISLFLLIIALSAALQSAPYRIPYQQNWTQSRIRTESHIPGDLMVRTLSSAFSIDINRARLISVLLVYADLAEDPDSFSSVADFMSSMLYDMKTAMEGWDLRESEDSALRDLSKRLSPFIDDSRSYSWQELKWAFEDSVIPFTRELSSH